MDGWMDEWIYHNNLKENLLVRKICIKNKLKKKINWWHCGKITIIYSGDICDNVVKGDNKECSGVVGQWWITNFTVGNVWQWECGGWSGKAGLLSDCYLTKYWWPLIGLSIAVIIDPAGYSSRDHNAWFGWRMKKA